MKNLKLKPVALVAILLATTGTIAFLYAGTDGKSDSAPAASRPALTVAVALPEQNLWPIELTANGSIAAWQESIVGAELNGLRLKQVRANVGDRVKAGQVLARFSDDSIRIDLAHARARLIEAQAMAAEAADNAARARTLEGSGTISLQQIQQYLTAAQTTEARVAEAQAALDAQRLRAEQTEVRAPDSGIVSARRATVGAVVGAGEELFRLIRGGRLEWRAEVTADEMGRIAPGGQARVVAASGAEIQGRVRTIAPTVDPATRIALVYVDLPSSPDATSPVKAGMFARGVFDIGTASALTVPQSALVLRDGFTYLFHLGPDQKVVQTKVETGRRMGERVEIVRGLTPAARIVVSGAGFLNDGDQVRVSALPMPAQTLVPSGAASAGTK